MRAVTAESLIAEGVLRIEDGNHGEYRPRPDEFTDSGVPYIRAADMHNGRIDVNSAGRINSTARERIRKGIGAPGDVLLSHKGTVGLVSLAPADIEPYICSPQTTFWRTLDSNVLDRRYLANFLRSETFQHHLRSIERETDMAAYVSLSQQKQLLIEVPPIDTQRAIADVLGALDDKIAANRRAQQLSIEMASTEFRSRISAIECEREYQEVATIGGGGTPSTTVDEYWNGSIAWTTPTDVTALEFPYLESTEKTITEEGLAACASPIYPAGSILMTSRATIGAFAVAGIPVAVNQGFIVVQPFEPSDRWWLFHAMQAQVDMFKQLANGATFLELGRGKFKGLPLPWPSDTDRAQFDAVAAPLHAQARQLAKESTTLATLRDALLPELMSGRLRVKDAEKAVEEVL